MSDNLDLDALERWWFTLPDTPGRKQTFALIQRLREVEAGWKQAEIDRRSAEASLMEQEPYITQLEWVREAAAGLMLEIDLANAEAPDPQYGWDTETALRAALAAVEEEEE